jgi:hypothetical protein
MSLITLVEVEDHVKLIDQILDNCPVKNAKQIKNFLRIMLNIICIMLSKCQTTHTHTHTHTQHRERTVVTCGKYSLNDIVEFRYQ